MIHLLSICSEYSKQRGLEVLAFVYKQRASTAHSAVNTLWLEDKCIMKSSGRKRSCSCIDDRTFTLSNQPEQKNQTKIEAERTVI